MNEIVWNCVQGDPEGLVADCCDPGVSEEVVSHNKEKKQGQDEKTRSRCKAL